MKRYKILITLLIVVLSFSVIFVPQCSAGNTSLTLKQLMDGGSLFAYGYVNSTTETSLTANTSHWSECVRIYGDQSYVFYGFDVMSNDSTLFSNFPDGSLLTLSTGRFVWAYQTGGVPDVGVWKMRFGFRILLSDGTFKYIYTDWYNNTSYGTSEPSFKLPYLEWAPIEFSTYLPDNCERIYSFTFEFTAVDGIDSGHKTTGVQYFMMWSGKFNFFIGPLSDAPIYEGPDTSGYDEYHASEDALLNDTADGRESVGSAIDDGFSALAPGGTLYNSLYFWRELMNDAINDIPMLSPMITVSLAFGLVVFILGGSLVKVLTKEPDDKVPRRRGKGD